MIPFYKSIIYNILLIILIGLNVRCENIKYSEIGAYDKKGLAIAKVRGKEQCYVMINNNGKAVSKEYKTIYYEFNGYNIAEHFNGGYSFLNYYGVEITDEVYEAVELPQLVLNKLIAKVAINDKWGIVDLNRGENITPIRYDHINNFNQDLAIVKNDNKYGILNYEGEIVIPIKYNYIKHYRDDLYICNLHNMCGIIKDEEVVVPPQYTEIYAIGDTYALVNDAEIVKTIQIYDGLTEDIFSSGGAIKDMKNGVFAKHIKPGIMKFFSLSNSISEPKGEYADIKILSDGIAGVKWERQGLFGGLYGFINHQGYRIIPPKYDDVGSFNEGLTPVKIGCKWGYINSHGDEVVRCMYDYATDFRNGFATINIGGRPGPYGSISGGKWGLINLRGEEVLPVNYPHPIHFENNRAILNVTNGYIIINEKMEEVFNLHLYYNSAIINDNYIEAHTSGHKILYDLDGNIVYRENINR